MRILIFGDNIAHGLWDTDGGWVQRLRSQYDKASLQNLGSEYPDIYNLSISGETAQGVLKRLNFEMKPRIHQEQPIIVIAVGMNDSLIYKGVEATPPELFKGELQQIILATRQFTDKILFIGLTCVDDAACNPWQYSSTGKCFNNERIWQFEKTIRSLCKEENVLNVEIYEKFQKGHEASGLLADGLYPNGEGHSLIAGLVKTHLDKLITV